MTCKHKIRDDVLKVRSGCNNAGSSLLPALHTTQQNMGWLSNESLTIVADTLGLPAARIKGVATFYSMLDMKPTGRHIIRLCTNIACMIMGADRFIDILRDRYDLLPGSATKDGRFSLCIMECIGSCGTAPAMLVNNDFYHGLTADTLTEILDRYE
ncbi:MAG TPA: NAD(P)H-dependent oxidoreductase subunit E [Dissulfurispiraceae bacterium]|nr:NAD(P)H-dependent oxidoreductase subunit E [Dissulfurispiraceae bacterium]